MVCWLPGPMQDVVPALCWFTRTGGGVGCGLTIPLSLSSCPRQSQSTYCLDRLHGVLAARTHARRPPRFVLVYSDKRGVGCGMIIPLSLSSCLPLSTGLLGLAGRIRTDQTPFPYPLVSRTNERQGQCIF